jgi:hypothetical protein
MTESSHSEDLNSLRAEVAALGRRVGELERQLADRGGVESSGQGEDGELFEILSVDAKPVSETEGEVRMSWKMTVQSQSDRDLRVVAQVQFVDMDSFVIDEERVESLMLSARQRQKFGGIKTVSASQGEVIMGVKGTLSLIE